MHRKPRVSLDHLRGFRSAARHLSFTRAAEELFVTQSAISHEIRALEEQLGRPLFERVNRTLRLTADGETLYRAADSALTQIDDAVDQLTDASETLTVHTTTALASLWLAPRLSGFNREHPGIGVRIVTSNDTLDTRRDRFDVALRFATPGADAPQGEPLMKCWTFPACAPSLTGDASRPLRVPRDLARHVRLDYESIRDGRRWSEWGYWFETTRTPRVDPASTLWFPQFDQCVPAAIDGAGVAVGVLPHLTPQMRDGLLCAPFGGTLVALRGTFYIVVGKESVGRQSVADLTAWAREEAAADARVFPFPTGAA